MIWYDARKKNFWRTSLSDFDFIPYACSCQQLWFGMFLSVYYLLMLENECVEFYLHTFSVNFSCTNFKLFLLLQLHATLSLNSLSAAVGYCICVSLNKRWTTYMCVTEQENSIYVCHWTWGEQPICVPRNMRWTAYMCTTEHEVNSIYTCHWTRGEQHICVPLNTRWTAYMCATEHEVNSIYTCHWTRGEQHICVPLNKRWTAYMCVTEHEEQYLCVPLNKRWTSSA